MRKFTLLAILMLVSVVGFSQLAVEGPFKSVGTNSTITTGAVDTVYFRAKVPSSGNTTITATFTGESGNTLMGRLKLWVSLNGEDWFEYPSRSTTDTSMYTLNAAALVAVPTSTPTATRVYKYTKSWEWPISTANTSVYNINNGNRYTWYMWEFISTTGTSGTITCSGSYLCRKIGN